MENEKTNGARPIPKLTIGAGRKDRGCSGAAVGKGCWTDGQEAWPPSHKSVHHVRELLVVLNKLLI